MVFLFYLIRKSAADPGFPEEGANLILQIFRKSPIEIGQNLDHGRLGSPGMPHNGNGQSTQCWIWNGYLLETKIYKIDSFQNIPPIILHWWFQGGARDAPPVQFLSCSWPNNSFSHASWELAPPPGILDPPQFCDAKFTQSKNLKTKRTAGDSSHVFLTKIRIVIHFKQNWPQEVMTRIFQ